MVLTGICKCFKTGSCGSLIVGVFMKAGTDQLLKGKKCSRFIGTSLDF
jgi:hypothetical protein